MWHLHLCLKACVQTVQIICQDYHWLIVKSNILIKPIRLFYLFAQWSCILFSGWPQWLVGAWEPSKRWGEGQQYYHNKDCWMGFILSIYWFELLTCFVSTEMRPRKLQRNTYGNWNNNKHHTTALGKTQFIDASASPAFLMFVGVPSSCCSLHDGFI